MVLSTLKHDHFRPFTCDKNFIEIPWLEMCSYAKGLICTSNFTSRHPKKVPFLVISHVFISTCNYLHENMHFFKIHAIPIFGLTL